MDLRRYRPLERVFLALLAVLLIGWTLLPVYHMAMMAIVPSDQVFSANLWPSSATLDNFGTIFTQGSPEVENFWRQLINSIVVAFVTTTLVLVVGSSASFTIVRLRPRWGGTISNAALATYVIPSSFVAIPLYRVMAEYQLLDTHTSLILALVAFASPYAIWVFSQYAQASLPMELDESARVDGAKSWQIYLWIFLPLMRPVLVAIGTYALLLAWNEYLLAFLLLSTEEKMTLPVALGSFLNTDQPPWSLLMATSLVYALPPVFVYYFFRGSMVGGLTTGGVKN